jgi:hypothetical protein
MILSALHSKWLMRLFVAFSAFYGFVYVASLHTYMPLWKCVIKGLGITLEGHLGLWLATLQIKGRVRFLVALILLAPLLGLYALWYELHPAVAISAVIYTSSILFQTVRGTWLETQSI